jgi:hypothetical protein
MTCRLRIGWFNSVDTPHGAAMYMRAFHFERPEKCPRSVQARYIATRLNLRKSLILNQAGHRVRTDDPLITNHLLCRSARLHAASSAHVSIGEQGFSTSPGKRRERSKHIENLCVDAPQNATLLLPLTSTGLYPDGNSPGKHHGK